MPLPAPPHLPVHVRATLTDLDMAIRDLLAMVARLQQVRDALASGHPQAPRADFPFTGGG